MTLEQHQVVSAQVVLRSASGRAIDDRAVITAETLKDFAPSPETVARATAAFAAAGFDVGAMVGISFSITAPVSTFEDTFKIQLRQQEHGGIEAVADDGIGTYDLPLHALSKPTSDLIVAVTFTPPPDFGPTEFHGP